MGTSPDPKDQTFDIFDEISDFLKWSQDRVGPLTFTGLAIAALLWLDFLKFFSLPVSFLSLSSLAAMPALFATVVFAVIVLVFDAIMPGFVLWTPLYPGGPCLSLLGQQQQGSTPNTTIVIEKKIERQNLSAREANKVRKKLIKCWVSVNLLIGMLWILWVASTLYPVITNPNWLVLPNFALSIACGLLLFYFPIKKIAQENPSVPFLLRLSCAIFAQSVVAFSILFVFLKTTTDTEIWTLISHAALYELVLFLLSLTQLLVAQRVALGPYPNMLKHVTLGVIVVMTFVAAMNPVGAMLASYPLRANAPDGGSCIVLTLLPVQMSLPNSPTVYATVQDLNNPGHTVPLAFVTHLENTYYAKIDPLHGDVYPISDTLVGGIGSCRKGNNVPVDANGKPVSHTKHVTPTNPQPMR